MPQAQDRKQLDMQFSDLQSSLGANDLVPCRNETSDRMACLPRAHSVPGFFYGMDAVKVAKRVLCPTCLALWLVGVARNLILDDAKLHPKET